MKGNYRGCGRYEGHQQCGSTNQVVNQGYSSDSSEDNFAFSVTADKDGVHAVTDEPVVPLRTNKI